MRLILKLPLSRKINSRKRRIRPMHRVPPMEYVYTLHFVVVILVFVAFDDGLANGPQTKSKASEELFIGRLIKRLDAHQLEIAFWLNAENFRRYSCLRHASPPVKCGQLKLNLQHSDVHRNYAKGFWPMIIRKNTSGQFPKTQRYSHCKSFALKLYRDLLLSVYIRFRKIRRRFS